MFKHAMRDSMEEDFKERGHDIYLKQWKDWNERYKTEN